MQHRLPSGKTGNDNAPTKPVCRGACTEPHRKGSRPDIPWICLSPAVIFLGLSGSGDVSAIACFDSGYRTLS